MSKLARCHWLASGKYCFLVRKVIKAAASRNVGYTAEEATLDPRHYADFKKYLKNHKIAFKDGHTCLQLDCKMCNKSNENSEQAYINKRTGTFLCPSCEVKRPLLTVMQMYEKELKLSDKDVTINQYQSRFQTDYVPITQNICDSMGIRGLKVTDLEAVGARYSASADLLHFPLKNATQQIVGEKVWHLSERREETFQGDNHSGLLIYAPPINRAKAVLVTNLLDFLVLTMQRFDNFHIVCLPYGLKTLPQECLPALERFKELIFWFNFDSTGWDAAKGLASKMDEKRCLLIRPTDTEPAPSEAYRKRFNLRHILHKAMPVRHKSITTFNALRNDILSELQNIEKVNGVKWKRFPVLNKLLKGHRKGELTIISGPTGSGKTTFMSEYSLDLALQGVSTLWGSFEIRNSRLAATLLRQFVGYSLENKLNEFDYWATEFEKYPLYFMTFHGQQPLKVVMEAIEHAQYVHDINHVIIDNLQFMMGVSTSQRTDKFWEQDAIISSFRGFATKHNVHVTLVMHPRKEREEDDLTTSSVFGTAKATQEADNVLIIQDKRLTSVRGKKYLQIMKNRYSGDLGIMPLEFDKDSLSYSAASRKRKEKEKEEKKERDERRDKEDKEKVDKVDKSLVVL